MKALYKLAICFQLYSYKRLIHSFIHSLTARSARFNGPHHVCS